MSNERLLLEYGFVLTDRHDDELNLPFGAIDGNSILSYTIEYNIAMGRPKRSARAKKF